MDISVEHLREHRERPSVLKTELASIRSHDRCALVFVLEGWDDAKAYEVWIRRATPGLRWEALVAKGKKKSLAFREMLERDTTGLRECTYFIVDNDYDGLAGAANGLDLYILPAYSIENLLTHPEVLGSLLTTEFRLIGDLKSKTRVINLYRKAVADFSTCVRPACETLHASKRKSAGNVTIDDRHLKEIQVNLEAVVTLDPKALSLLVQTQQTLEQHALEAARDFFDSADPGLWTRGKFIMWFFKEWCSKLMADRGSPTPIVFSNTLAECSFSGEWSAIGSLAARSPLPLGLEEFIRQAAKICSASCGKTSSQLLTGNS
ncbi:DUF4435 domain-containing protein [Corallococcus sp. 4LFB]|uniref:DUF4435 domain-containing protein n=1 Tax=Corallococcus sp. 4LFB TaxID=3383249 RepID=UPI003975F0CA